MRTSVNQKRAGKQHKMKKNLLHSRGFAAGAAAAILVLLAGGLLVNHFGPTNEKMSLYEYFDVEEGTGDVQLILNHSMTEYKGFYEGDTLYVPQEFVEQELNQRFYFDKESAAVLYTDSAHVYTYQADSKEYTDQNGNIYTTDVPVVVTKDGMEYMDMTSVSNVSDFDYAVYDAPKRAVIYNLLTEETYVTAGRKTAVRYRGGNKSPVLEYAEAGDKLVYRRTLDEWMEVETASGLMGYVKTGTVSDSVTQTRESKNIQDFATGTRDHKISMVWFQVGGTAGNASVNGLLSGVSGINTISPTWYTIENESGSLTSYASADFVNTMHRAGVEVWPLINDFNGMDTATVFGSKASRTKIIHQLMTDSNQYGYDGINVDFEKVDAKGAKDFLQFIRELSVECHSQNIVLSIDNYKPEAFNACYDIKEQGAYADYIVLMGYDEHYAGSDSGSVASIGFVEEGIQDALALVSNKKLINGMPFYTRIWTENGGTTTSTAVGMQSAIDRLNKNNAPAIWDETVGQYFGSYESSEGTVKIWLEEDRSIEEKLKLYQKYDLAGVSGWKLGLEKPSVWTVINKYISNAG